LALVLSAIIGTENNLVENFDAAGLLKGCLGVFSGHFSKIIGRSLTYSRSVILIQKFHLIILQLQGCSLQDIVSPGADPPRLKIPPVCRIAVR